MSCPRMKFVLKTISKLSNLEARRAEKRHNTAHSQTSVKRCPVKSQNSKSVLFQTCQITVVMSLLLKFHYQFIRLLYCTYNVQYLCFFHVFCVLRSTVGCTVRKTQNYCSFFKYLVPGMDVSLHFM